MADPWWNVISALTGGVLATGGTLLFEEIRDRRGKHRAKAEHRRANLYAIQDEVANIVENVNYFVECKSEKLPYDPLNTAAYNNLNMRLSNLSVRLGDGQISARLLELTVIIGRARSAEQYSEAMIEFDRATKVIGHIQSRIFDLLNELGSMGASN